MNVTVVLVIGDLVKVLRTQHEAAPRVTDVTMRFANRQSLTKESEWGQLVTSMQQFVLLLIVGAGRWSFDAPLMRGGATSQSRQCRDKREKLIRSLRGSNPKGAESRFVTKVASSLREYEGNQLPRNCF